MGIGRGADSDLKDAWPYLCQHPVESLHRLQKVLMIIFYKNFRLKVR